MYSSGVGLTFNLKLYFCKLQTSKDNFSKKASRHLPLLGCAKKIQRILGPRFGWFVFVLKIHIGNHQNTQGSTKLVLNINNKDKRIKIPNNSDCFNTFCWSSCRCISEMLMNWVLWFLKSTETKLTSKAQRGVNSLITCTLPQIEWGGQKGDVNKNIHYTFQKTSQEEYRR